MAATANVYSKDTLNDQNNGNDQQVYVYQPLALQEYNSDANFCANFFVQKVWHKTDSEDKECAIGLLEDNSSYSLYQMHASSRIGKLRLKLKDNNVWKNYIVLNDGGLNTKAHCYFAGSGHDAYVNYLKVTCCLRTAYYANNNSFTISISNLDHPSYEYSFPLISPIEGNIFPKKYSTLGYIAELRGANLGEVGDRIQLTISSSNEEGEYTCSDTITLTLKPAQTFVKVYYFSEQDYDNTQDPTTGTPYALQLSEDMYAAPRPQTSEGGVIYEMIQAAGDPVLAETSERLMGVQLPPGAEVDYAYGASLSALPNGYYYGVPINDMAGSDGYVYVWVTNNNVASTQTLRMRYNQYRPVVPTDYHVTLSANIQAQVGSANYIVTIYATVDNGELPNGGVTVSTKFYENIHPVHGPQNPKFGGGTFSAHIPEKNRGIVLHSYTCAYGDALASNNDETYGSPASTNASWITGVILNWNNIPNNSTNN